MDNNIIDKRTKGEWAKSTVSHINRVINNGKVICGCYSFSEGISDEESEANAAFIVKACNEYDKLVSQKGLAEIELNHKTTLLTACEDALCKSNQQRELLLEALKRIEAKSWHKNEWDEMNEINLISREGIKKCSPLT